MRILLVPDVPGWALDLTAKYIQKSIDCDIVYSSGEPRFEMGFIRDYDRIHFMNWLDGQTIASNVTGGVCSHNWELKWLGVAKKELPRFKKLVCISQKLYDKVKQYNPNVHYIPNGVDTGLFKPVKHKGDFTVGYVGQPTSGGFGEKKTREGRKIYDIKGYELLLKPLMKTMSNTQFKVLTRDYTNAVPYEEMPKWYSDIDVLICTSLWEGCPFPVLEASACGKPVISTKVGIVPELIKEGHNGFLIDNIRSREDIPRALNAFENRILMLKEHRELAQLMGGKNREEILKSWTWEKVIPLWREFFGKDKTT